MTQDLRLMIGDRGSEKELPAYLESPTWIVDRVWASVDEVAQNSLAAYLSFCRRNGLPHSYFLGLDILITGVVSDRDERVVTDIRPTILEGPCCNSYPACPNLWAARLYGQMKAKGIDPDIVEYPTHPTQILQKIAQLHLNIWKAKSGDTRPPRVGVFTRPYEESEEESAHCVTLQGFRDAGMDAYRITPAEKPEVKDGKIWVDGKPMDMCWRRIERIHVRPFYGERLGARIIDETPETIWINPWKVDDLRSKTIEERCFREWEAETGKVISRPVTLLGQEITPERVREISARSGYALKMWNSTGGKGVFLHLNLGKVRKVADALYGRYDGRHMILLDPAAFDAKLQEFKSFKEDASIQQMRLIDSRALSGGRFLCYDTRINVLYDSFEDRWEYLSGMSRSVPCGAGENGNSLLTNVSSGAEVSPLIMGQVKRGADRSQMRFGPLAQALMEGKDEARL